METTLYNIAVQLLHINVNDLTEAEQNIGRYLCQAKILRLEQKTNRFVLMPKYEGF